MKGLDQGIGQPRFRLIREKRRSLWNHKALKKSGPCLTSSRVADAMIEAEMPEAIFIDQVITQVAQLGRINQAVNTA
jgi:hypothetical protein